jgi:hypothetical protein
MVHTQGTRPEPPSGELQAQIDRLVLALHQWRQAQERSQPDERHLRAVNDSHNEVLTRWEHAQRRHEEAVARLEGQIQAWRDVQPRPCEDLHQLQGGQTPVSKDAATATAIPETIAWPAHSLDGQVAVPDRTHVYVSALLAVVLLGLLAAGALAFRHLDARLDEATARATAAEDALRVREGDDARALTALRAELERPITDTARAAATAQAMTAVLAAPNLVRYPLAGTGQSARARGMLLLSRSHGMILTALNLPPAGPDTSHQIWLVTDRGRVSAGTFVPDSDGRAIWVAAAVPTVPFPIVSVEVTLEPAGGSPSPSGAPVLTRLAARSE